MEIKQICFHESTSKRWFGNGTHSLLLRQADARRSADIYRM